MAWKKLPDWLKGGIIGLSVSVAYLAILFFLQMTNFGRSALSGGFGLLFYPIRLIVNGYCNTFVFPTQAGDLFSCNISVPWLIFIVIVALIGAGSGYLKTKI